MYQNHFSLAVMPFESTPDPAFIYLRDQYRDALAGMIHAVVARKALMVVAGPIGSGKTTLGQALTRYLPDKTQLIPIIHPMSDQGELITFLAHQLELPITAVPRLVLIENVRQRLLEIGASGGRVVALIDEAQLLTDESLEEIRLLTNLETGCPSGSW